MLKKTIIFALIIGLLTLLGACASYRAAYKNVTESTETGMPAASVLQEQGEESAGTAEPAGTVEAAETVETVETAEPAEIAGSSGAVPVDKKAALLDEIIKTDVAYSKYLTDTFEADYDGDGESEFFFVFTEKSAQGEDDIGSSADIWFGDDSGVKRVAEWQCIDPDTYGSLKLAGKYYFRYDLAFVTEHQTILLSVNDGNSIVSFKCMGFAEFGGTTGNSTDDFTVTNSTYDMVYLKSDDITCGHTWKKYFYYADADGFHEYGAVKITRGEFLQYTGANKILDEIGKEYGKVGVKLSFGFLKRCNGLLHININSETKDDITHYFITFKTDEDGTLEKLESGDGYYAPANNPEIAVYK